MTALGHLSRGDDVAVLPLRQDLSSQEAAAFLMVSRPFLVRLLDEGRIPHRKVGRKRRVLLEDLRAYQRQTQVGLRAAAPSGSRGHRRRAAAGA
ncbi:helix-turn-helix domain-containing protein [Falsiroseomonas algicola]